MQKYFYKYRSITSYKSLENDYAIDALFKNQAVFSNRKNFNDLFDSKNKFIKPTHQQIKSLKPNLLKKHSRDLSKFITKGKYTHEGYDYLNEIETKLNELIDSYVFYCVSSNPVSNLMWSHYANSHRGFCIELKSEYLNAEKVTYTRKIPSIELLDLLKYQSGLTDGKHFGKKIWSALRTKLVEWEYENEYRFQANNSMQQQALEKRENYTKIQYPSDFVKSIIFGCRMEKEARDFIIKNIPFETDFKEVIVKASSLQIVDYKSV